jgi:hypothetical protein
MQWKLGIAYLVASSCYVHDRSKNGINSSHCPSISAFQTSHPSTHPTTSSKEIALDLELDYDIIIDWMQTHINLTILIDRRLAGGGHP